MTLVEDSTGNKLTYKIIGAAMAVHISKFAYSCSKIRGSPHLPYHIIKQRQRFNWLRADLDP